LRLSYLLSHVSSGRLFQEVLKFFQEGASFATVMLMQKYKLFAELFPETSDSLSKPEAMALLQAVLNNTDQRIKEGKAVSPAFLFAVFLWHPLLKEITLWQSKGLPAYISYEKSLQQILKKQIQVLAIPRAMQMTIREICLMQFRFQQRRGLQPFRLLDHPRFRAGYDLLLMRAQTDATLAELAQWWTDFYSTHHEERMNMINTIQKPPSSKKKRRRK
jgi:poly(A) polymerase